MNKCAIAARVCGPIKEPAQGVMAQLRTMPACDIVITIPFAVSPNCIRQNATLAQPLIEQSDLHPHSESQNGTFRNENGEGRKLDGSASGTFTEENGTTVPFSHFRPSLAHGIHANTRFRTRLRTRSLAFPFTLVHITHAHPRAPSAVEQQKAMTLAPDFLVL
jgi:hypothetical protein